MAPLNHSDGMAQWLEEAWLTRYFERDLTEEECGWFEAYMLDKGCLLDKLAADLSLRDGYALATARGIDLGEHRGEQAHALPSSDMVPRGRAPRLLQFRTLAQAASIVLAFGIGALVSGAFELQREDPVVVNPTRVVVDVSRGGENAGSIENASDKSAFILVDAIVPVDATNVVVRGPGLTDRRVTVSRDGIATLLVRRSELLKIGRLTISGDAAGRKFERPISLDIHEPGGHP